MVILTERTISDMSPSEATGGLFAFYAMVGYAKGSVTLLASPEIMPTSMGCYG